MIVGQRAASGKLAGTLQVADGLGDYCWDSIGYRCLHYKYQEAALQVAGCSGKGEGPRDTLPRLIWSNYFAVSEKNCKKSGC